MDGRQRTIRLILGRGKRPYYKFKNEFSTTVQYGDAEGEGVESSLAGKNNSEFRVPDSPFFWMVDDVLSGRYLAGEKDRIVSS